MPATSKKKHAIQPIIYECAVGKENNCVVLRQGKHRIKVVIGAVPKLIKVLAFVARS